jgi:membrane-associated phospholipid phosphatase
VLERTRRERLTGISPWYALAIVGAALFVILAMAVAGGTPLTTLDRTLAEHLQKGVTPRSLEAFRIVTLLGTGWALGVASGVVAVGLLLRRHFVLAIGWVVAQGGAVLLVKIVKYFVQRDRPGLGDTAFYAHGWSFPSGHVVRTVAFCGMAAYLVLRLTGSRRASITVAIVGLTWSLAMACSRLYLGAHFPSDVTAGIVLGVAWVGLCIGLIERKVVSGGVT